MTDARSGDIPETEITPSGFPRSPTEGNGTMTLFSVEARYIGEHPKSFSGLLLGGNWKRLKFPTSPIGVPVRTFHVVDLQAIGLLGYAAAQALRWWFHAAEDAHFWNHNLETRLVEHRVKYHYDSTAVGACELVIGDGPLKALAPRQGQSQDDAQVK